MRVKLKRSSLLLIALTIVLFAANSSWAQDDTTPKKRLRSPATARGIIGGESHDSYVIHARKGRTMTVQISWQRADDNQAEFTVSESANFFNGAQVGFGKASEKGIRWSGKIPKTGDYYIYVVAHPTARYTLRVRLK
jgi:hypothetical protein